MLAGSSRRDGAFRERRRPVSPKFLQDFRAQLPEVIGSGEKKRVGLIGTGWYGKCDLWRLVQLAPVEIVSLCDHGFSQPGKLLAIMILILSGIDQRRDFADRGAGLHDRLRPVPGVVSWQVRQDHAS